MSIQILFAVDTLLVFFQKSSSQNHLAKLAQISVEALSGNLNSSLGEDGATPRGWRFCIRIYRESLSKYLLKKQMAGKYSGKKAGTCLKA